MKALILAAGYATRLWPLTKNKPKPMLEVKGKPIIEHIISTFSAIAEIDVVYVVTNEKFTPDFEEWAAAHKGRIPIKVINDMTTSNDDRKGAVGDMQYAIAEEKIDDALLVIAGDNLFEYKLADFYDFYKKKGSSVVAAKEMPGKDDVKEKFGVVEIDGSERVTGFEEKPLDPKTALAATACYIFTKDDVREIGKYIEGGNKPDNAGDFIKWLSGHKPVFAFVFREKWYDIGSFESLGKAREEFNG
ncbi:MAG TPA: nucleotidyltransferase family protein [Candidatus Diapherotrites archaeon]|uniref:Nucleotidyltransferase family protein n=1 Tax=Candidatus Iainarchaeum sp. TaxID=3101447 RepID=A0A7J4IWN9_9ARCH|nr:nucleotidyltransferase family protein [Candidatus Diapherotrites archaeon]